MHFSMSRWLRHLSLVIAAWVAIAATSPAVSQEKNSSAAGTDDGSSAAEVVIQDGAEGQAADDPAARPAEPAAPADQASGGPAAPGDEPLEPIPDPQHSTVVQTEVASFNGVTPGATTSSEIQKLWGPPKEIGNRNAQLVHLYSVQPFSRVEVSFVRDRVAAIVIRLDRAFPADRVAEQLQLSNIRPVMISNELGDILGESFPERGVMFAFEPSETPGRASMKVVQIILEPVSAEGFVLRAETRMDNEPEASVRDLDEAIKLDPDHGRAHWLRARLLAGAGTDPTAALEAVAHALRVEPANPQYRVTRAEILGRLGRFADAAEDAGKAAEDGTKRPHVQARALCLLGDLASSQPRPDYHQALQDHVAAIKLADPLSASRHPAVRLAAKEVLIDAHLGAATDIAWGPWDQKETAVPQWLERAAALSKDLIENEGGSVQHDFRLATRALGAYAGLRGSLDPGEWAQKTLDTGQQLLASVPSAAQKHRISWDLGMALYDAVQLCQMRREHDLALQHGQQAVEYLESAAETEEASASEAYLLGRLYFRLGAIQAVGKKDHSAAAGWFDKATPVLQQAAARLDHTESGRLGETFVSMAVSYWETDQRDQAIDLTERGIALIEEAVRRGTLEQTALEIPYSNLATMLRQMGQNDQADKYLLEARKAKEGTLR